ncbi:MAG: hypothetical protein IKZ47_02895 [Clostridia bacterium]|nr:hypothetical protein [Clostridia bacterium]
MSKAKKWIIAISAVFLVALIAILSYILYFGTEDYYGDTKIDGIKGIKQSNEENASAVTFTATYAVVGAPAEISDTVGYVDFEAIKSVMGSRLVNAGITYYDFSCDEDNSTVKVSFSKSGDVSGFDFEGTVYMLCQRGLITFCRNEDNTDVIVSGFSDIESAKPVYIDNQPVVQLKFTEAGKEKFAAATAELIGQKISIWLDDTMLSCPTVNTAITDGSAIITGMGDFDSATYLANMINGGVMPYTLKVVDYSMK